MASNVPATPDATPPVAPPSQGGVAGALEDQFALRGLIWEYLIPVETNTLWYTLGGVLGIALGLEFLTGFLLTLRYDPDAGRAYQVTAGLMHEHFWSFIIDFHYFNSFLIFGLVMLHMMRVFVSGGYRRGKQGLWLVGVVLAGLTFLLTLTGEALHWDEVGFAVPWHTSEFLQALGIERVFHYTFADLRNIPSATPKLTQLYGIHIAILPVLLVAFMMLHYYLIREKHISLPFWHRASGRTTPFSHHIRAWVLYGAVLIGAIVLLAVFTNRDTGVAPQLIPTSPYFGSAKGPGKLGAKPNFPISWTHGMNVFVDEKLHITPDIWGTVAGMVLMLGALVIIPFVDRSDHEPKDWREAFDWRQRGFAFAAIILFWAVMIIGIVQNAIAGPA
jgi:ubiquinol-cytochrome c reductase cytochrome b subunit